MPNKGNRQKPGEIAEVSGQCERLNARGQPTGHEVTAVKGKPLPPTPKRRQTYRLVDPTKHKKR